MEDDFETKTWYSELDEGAKKLVGELREAQHHQGNLFKLHPQHQNISFATARYNVAFVAEDPDPTDSIIIVFTKPNGEK